MAAYNGKLQSLRLGVAELQADLRALKSLVAACGIAILALLLGVGTLLLRTRGLSG